MSKVFDDRSDFDARGTQTVGLRLALNAAAATPN
jgi:hypothetical protein